MVFFSRFSFVFFSCFIHFRSEPIFVVHMSKNKNTFYSSHDFLFAGRHSFNIIRTVLHAFRIWRWTRLVFGAWNGFNLFLFMQPIVYLCWPSRFFHCTHDSPLIRIHLNTHFCIVCIIYSVKWNGQHIWHGTKKKILAMIQTGQSEKER